MHNPQSGDNDSTSFNRFLDLRNFEHTQADYLATNPGGARVLVESQIDHDQKPHPN